MELAETLPYGRTIFAVIFAIAILPKLRIITKGLNLLKGARLY